jgi:urease accessory protein
MELALSPVAEARQARADLRFERRGTETVLAECRATAPLRVGPPVRLESCAYATVVNIAGGVVAGDAFDHRIEIGPNAHALVTTQSATKLYGSSGPTARSSSRVLVGPGAVMEWVPDPVIPFSGARYTQSVTIEIASGGAAIVADAWAAGRVAQGEHWAAWLDGACRIDLCGRPVYRDHFAASPGCAADFEGWSYLATWVAVADRPVEWESLAVRTAEVTEAREPAVYGGASVIRGGMVVRFAASSAAALAETSDVLWSAIRQALLGVPRPHLRKY